MQRQTEEKSLAKEHHGGELGVTHRFCNGIKFEIECSRIAHAKYKYTPGICVGCVALFVCDEVMASFG